MVERRQILVRLDSWKRAVFPRQIFSHLTNLQRRSLRKSHSKLTLFLSFLIAVIAHCRRTSLSGRAIEDKNRTQTEEWFSVSDPFLFLPDRRPDPQPHEIGNGILTLCFHTTLYADGFAFTLHSKYTSSPSSMSSGFIFVPSSSFSVGRSARRTIEKQKKRSVTAKWIVMALVAGFGAGFRPDKKMY